MKHSLRSHDVEATAQVMLRNTRQKPDKSGGIRPIAMPYMMSTECIPQAELNHACRNNTAAPYVVIVSIVEVPLAS